MAKRGEIDKKSTIYRCALFMLRDGGWFTANKLATTCNLSRDDGHSLMRRLRLSSYYKTTTRLRETHPQQINETMVTSIGRESHLNRTDQLWALALRGTPLPGNFKINKDQDWPYQLQERQTEYDEDGQEKRRY